MSTTDLKTTCKDSSCSIDISFSSSTAANDDVSKRRRTMAETEALTSYDGRRRSPRSKTIHTRKLHRIRTIFWNDSGDDDDDDEIDDDGSTSSNNEEEEEEQQQQQQEPKKLNFGGRLDLTRIHTSPHIYTIDNFLTTAELHYFDDLILRTELSKNFSKSYIDQSGSSSSNNTNTSTSTDYNNNHNHNQQSYDSNRTSQFLQFQPHHSSKIATLESRAADLLGVCVECIEPLQLVRYEAGQYFNLHHDLGVLYEDGSVELPVLPPRRVCTIFVYLNDVPLQCGGCTRFPLLGPSSSSSSNNCNNDTAKNHSIITCREEQQGLCVQPVRGRALLWCNVDEGGRPEVRTVHSGEAIVDRDGDGGEDDNVNTVGVVKYGINIWICERSL